MGPSLLVGVPSAVPALLGAVMWSPLSVLRACADTAPSTGLTGSPSGAALPAVFHPASSLDGCRHLPMRLFSSFTSSCLRISPIRGHTCTTSTERRVRSGTGKRKLQGLWWKLRFCYISFHMESWQEWLSFLVLSANCMLGAIHNTSMFYPPESS